MTYYFSWESSGLGESTFRVSGAGDLQRLIVRYEATDYQRSISSYSDLDWQREVVASIGLLRAHHPHGRAIPPDLVDAFNAWRMAEYERSRADILRQHDRYQIKPEDYSDAIAPPPLATRGAQGEHYWVNPKAREVWDHGSVWCGWRVNSESAADRLARLDLTHQSYAEKCAQYVMEKCNGKRSQRDCDVALAEYHVAAGLLIDAQCAMPEAA